MNSDIIKIIFAIVLPPLGVFLERGCGADLLINILLTILGYIPGIIHALYVQTIMVPPKSSANGYSGTSSSSTSQFQQSASGKMRKTSHI